MPSVAYERALWNQTRSDRLGCVRDTEDKHIGIVFLQKTQKFIARLAVPQRQLGTATRSHLIRDEFVQACDRVILGRGKTVTLYRGRRVVLFRPLENMSKQEASTGSSRDGRCILDRALRAVGEINGTEHHVERCWSL